MQTLSDLVFGLALSLGAFVLIYQPPTTPAQLYGGILLFGFGFLILMTVWNNYSSIMSVLPMETRGLLIFNLVLLFVVVLEPYLLNIISVDASSGVAEAASVLYAFDIAAMNGILAAFLHVLAREESGLVTPSATRRMRVLRDYNLGSALFFAFTTLPVFWQWDVLPNFPSRIILWILTLPGGWAVRVLSRRWTSERA